MVEGISEVIDKENLNILIYNTNDKIEKEQKSLQMLLEQRIKGLVITVTSESYEKGKNYLDKFVKEKYLWFLQTGISNILAWTVFL